LTTVVPYIALGVCFLCANQVAIIFHSSYMHLNSLAVLVVPKTPTVRYLKVPKFSNTLNLYIDEFYEFVN